MVAFISILGIHMSFGAQSTRIRHQTILVVAMFKLPRKPPALWPMSCGFDPSPFESAATVVVLCNVLPIRQFNVICAYKYQILLMI